MRREPKPEDLQKLREELIASRRDLEEKRAALAKAQLRLENAASAWERAGDRFCTVPCD